MSSPIIAVIDSTLPYIWLPPSACDAFAGAFGLEYDPTTQLYLVNDTTHQTLQAKNPSITISLGDREINNDPAKLTRITLPYRAFDVQASYPIYKNATKSYFPIRRAANASEYTLGRTFMQEAYVIADYERSVFSVHQTSPDSQAPEIVSILPLNTINQPYNHMDGSKHNLSNASIAGITIGSVLAATVVIAVIVAISKRKTAAAEKTALKGFKPRLSLGRFIGHEIMSEEAHEMEQRPGELSESRVDIELDSNCRCPTTENGVAYELPI